nr:MFS transporter [Arthrobacter sp. AK01]
MFQSLGNRSYRLWAGGSLISNIGTWMQRMAQDWLVLTVLTDHSGTALGVTTGLQFLPVLFLGPYAGVLADRNSKRSILLWTQTAMGFCALAVGLLVVTGAAQLWNIYAAALCLGLASAIDGPTRQAFVSELVDNDQIANAVSLNSASFNIASLAGPALAGLLILWIGTGPVFLLNAASFAAVLVSLGRIRGADLIPFIPAARRGPQVAEGLSYVRGRPDLALILITVGVVGAFGLNFPITNALMVTSEFRLGPGELGVLSSLLAVGTLAGALLSARRATPRFRYLVVGATGLGTFTLIASISPAFWVYAVVLVPVGLSAMTFLNVCNTSIQLSVSPQLRGRVLALYLAVLQGGTALGAPLMGWIGTEFGARWALVTSGSAVVVTGVLTLIIICRRSPLTLRTQFRNILTKGPNPADCAKNHVSSTSGVDLPAEVS